MATEVIHVSAAEAARDFARLLERVREGAEVVIEDEARPVATIQATRAIPQPERPLRTHEDVEEFFAEMTKFSDKIPVLPDEAFTRESFYEERIRKQIDPTG